MDRTRLMAELREMARSPVVLFERFLEELQGVTGDRTMAAAVGMERVKELQAATVREFEGSLQRFRDKVGEAEAALGVLLRPPRPSLDEEIQRVAHQLQRLRDLAGHRDALRGRWEGESAEAVLQGYRAALEGHDVGLAELYEADAEEVLRRKGHMAALQAFLTLRAQAEDGRLTLSQRQARGDLEEIERLKNEVTLAARILASTLKASGSLAIMGAGWRRGSRVRLAPGEQGRTSVLIVSDAHPPMEASLVDVTHAGVRLALPQALPTGALLNLVVRMVDAPAEEIRMRGEVRWCRADLRSTGRFLAGVRLVSRLGDEWIALVSRLTEAGQDARVPLEGGST